MELHISGSCLLCKQKAKSPAPLASQGELAAGARVCCRKEGFGVSWQDGQGTHSSHTPAPGGVNSWVTQIYQDLPGAELVPASNSSKCSCSLRPGTAWAGDGQVKQASALKHRPHAQKSLEILCKYRKCGTFQAQNPSSPCNVCVCMEMTCKSANPPRSKQSGGEKQCFSLTKLAWVSSLSFSFGSHQLMRCFSQLCQGLSGGAASCPATVERGCP